MFEDLIMSVEQDVDGAFCVTNQRRKACLLKDVNEAFPQELVRRWNSQPALLAACESVALSLECMRLKDMPSCKKGDMCCVCEAKAAISAANAETTQK